MSLELNNICKKYNKKKQVLNNLCLEIQNNTVCSIVGTNGVGKKYSDKIYSWINQNR
jgi:ABC-type Mn2+/Zn2+ transport system ATPase subunit